MRMPLLKKLSKLIIILMITAVVLLISPSIIQRLYFYLKKLAQIYASVDALKEYTLSFGIWAPLIFFFVHILQIIFAPIPGNIVMLVGGALFGVFNGFILGGSGQIIGSLLAFYLARRFGKPLILKVIGQDTYDRYHQLFSGKFVIGLFFLFLLPFFPDDALCFVAGLSTMPLFLFLFLVVFCRLPGVFVATLAGAGIIDLTIAQWSLVLLLCLPVMYVFLKYHREIEDWLYQKLILPEKREDVHARARARSRPRK